MRVATTLKTAIFELLILNQDISVKSIDDRLQSIENSLSALSQKLTFSTRNDQDDILDIAGAAKLLHSTPGTIYVRVSQKTIPHIKDGSRVLFSRKSLLRILLSKEVKTIGEEISEADVYTCDNIKRKKKAA